ncbi:DMT family transporter [Sphingomonas piscis]|uniref:DMT family transporter n=1 Tax=Sphingomonas piscis TaxID=2714943 RepID=UPI001FE80C93|nr:DMT family transporter [Sphingomonas piscis]
MSSEQRSTLVAVVIPFVIFTAIWGSTWIVIRDQLVHVPAQWSVAYRFVIAAVAMAALTLYRGETLRLDRPGIKAAAVIGISQFVVNFNGVYIAERFITSGLVATVFALLLIPNTLLAWAMLGQRPSRRFLLWSIPSVAGVLLLFAHELGEHPTELNRIALGIAFTFIGIMGASFANVYQAQDKVKRYGLFALLAWSMAIGALCDALLAFLIAGPPVIEARPGYWIGLLYLALAASALAFSLYFPVVRRIGPARAAYSSVTVPLIAMSFSTWLEDYRWTP